MPLVATTEFRLEFGGPRPHARGVAPPILHPPRLRTAPSSNSSRIAPLCHELRLVISEAIAIIMSLSQQQLHHLRSLNDAAATCAIARIESLEKAASDQELRERTHNINTEQRFHELQARVAAISFEALQYKKQIEDLEAQVSSLVSKEKDLLARHSDASIAAARESSKAKRLEQQVDELHRDKVNERFAVPLHSIITFFFF